MDSPQDVRAEERKTTSTSTRRHATSAHTVDIEIYNMSGTTDTAHCYSSTHTRYWILSYINICVCVFNTFADFFLNREKERER